MLQVEKRIRNRVKRQMEKTQREYYLNEQMKAIQKELGEGEGGLDEMEELEKKIKETGLSKEAREKAEHEFKKLKQMSPMSAEATVVRNYLDWILSLPWDKRTRVKKDIKLAKKILDKDHYGLETGQGTHPGILGRPAAHEEGQGAYRLPRRSSGRRQNIPGPVHRQGNEPQLRPHVPRRLCAMKARSADTGAPISAHCLEK